MDHNALKDTLQISKLSDIENLCSLFTSAVALEAIHLKRMQNSHHLCVCFQASMETSIGACSAIDLLIA